jgi:hypothetical protein
MTVLDVTGPATAETVGKARNSVVTAKRDTKSSSRSLSKPQGQLADLAARTRFYRQIQKLNA